MWSSTVQRCVDGLCRILFLPPPAPPPPFPPPPAPPPPPPPPYSTLSTRSLLSPSPHPLRLSVLTGTDCPVGKYSEVGGIPSESQCKDCSAGRYNDAAGWSSPQGCKMCPARTFNKFSGSTSFAACTRCALGFYQNEPGQPACKAASCPRGTWGEILPNCTST